MCLLLTSRKATRASRRDVLRLMPESMPVLGEWPDFSSGEEGSVVTDPMMWCVKRSETRKGGG